jgi:predicted AAA+ superfamily ATPase
VGKTTLQEHLIDHLLRVEAVSPNRILRVQFDEIPSLRGSTDLILALCRWFETKVPGKSYNAAAREHHPVYLFFDEVQNLPDWAPQVKSLVDHHTVRVLLTGSSALRIEAGRDSLAGRISSLEMGPLLLREVALLRGYGELKAALPYNGLAPLKDIEFWRSLKRNGEAVRSLRDQAFTAFSERGGYPMAQASIDLPWERVADQLNETVIRRVIQHDLRLGDRGRKRNKNLLEELFRLCCRYAGQSPGRPVIVHELKDVLGREPGWLQVLNYLRFLNDTLLIRLVPPAEMRLKKRKGSRAKLCLCDHSLRASWLQEVVPVAPELLDKEPQVADLAGHIAESIAGYYLTGIPGLDVAWFPERGAEPEVDFVLTVGTQRVPVEVKYQRHIEGHRDTYGLRAFVEKSVCNAPFGVLVTQSDDAEVLDPRIVALPLSSLLLLR